MHFTSRLFTAPTVALLFLGMTTLTHAADRSLAVTYRAEITDIPDTAGKIGLWLPMPRSHKNQLVRNITLDSNHDYEILSDERFNNRFLYIEIVDLDAITELNEKPWISLSASVTRNTVDALETEYTLHNPQGDLNRYLDPATLIPLEGPILSEAKRTVGEEIVPLKQAKLLYDNIVETVRYDKTGDGWGRGDALYACDARTGNCTDFHSLFIGEARSLDIPARFLIGFPIPPDSPQGSVLVYHCWAEFFAPKKGWVPIDASEAQKDPSRKEELFGGLDPNRIEFTIGRDIPLPKSELPPLNYAIYPHLEINGKKSDAVSWSFTYKDE